MALRQSVIIIESPNKIEKVTKYSGCNTYATVGHFMKLETIDSDFTPKFIFDTKRKKDILKYVEDCKDKTVYIATDPDREGYAIGKMFYDLVKDIAKDVYRAEFHEITQQGIDKGLKEAKLFKDTNLSYYDSFLGRRVGDRLIGFSLSPYLANNLKSRGMSAGRVQTPALSIIVDREIEIDNFNSLPREDKLSYYIQAIGVTEKGEEFILKGVDKYNTKKEAEEALNNIGIDRKEGIVISLDTKRHTKSPAKPYITSKLLKDASKRLGLATASTQSIAQKLFEAGLITYIRTDAETLSKEFLDQAETYYKPIYPEEYVRREYKAKNSQAEAHEAIRITHTHSYADIEKVVREAKITDELAIKLYTLIFKNTVCSQMKDALIDKQTLSVDLNNYIFKATASKVVYKGYLGIFNDKLEDEDEDLKLEFNYKPKDIVKIKDIQAIEVEKKPPRRYLESDFIEVLEKKGIGRPSTYATYTAILQKRGYITIEGKQRELSPTFMGMSVIKFFREDPNNWILDLDYTKNMEDMLDDIMNHKLEYPDFVSTLMSKIKNINTNSLFRDAPAVKRPSSFKQLKFAKSLAKRYDKELPEGIEDDSELCKKFIESLYKPSNKPKSNGKKFKQWKK